ncbi:glycoside hydrolase family 2 protein [Globicatella sanguinis]
MMRQEYPRPQFERKNWINLNGEWSFELDKEAVGQKEKWYLNPKMLSKKIQVPFVYQSKLSGVEDKSACENVWYSRNFNIEVLTETTLLHFGAVDYQASIYVNNEFVGKHIGGHTSFTFDISNYVQQGDNVLTLSVFDPLTDEGIPRGKQYWKETPESIWYTNTTGIWQTVWIEQLADVYLEKVHFTPDLDAQSVKLNIRTNRVLDDLSIRIKIQFKNQIVVDSTSNLFQAESEIQFNVLQNKIMNTVAHGAGWTWSPENPNLFDVELILMQNGKIIDEVKSYFGMRKIHIENGKIMLNNRPYYQKLVLDQGYWPKSLMTAPTDEDFIKDIQLSKEMGFNGCRKHQKTEDPRFLYHADRLGFLVWGECAAPANYHPKSVKLTVNEWDEIIQRDYNHPSIIAWTPLNESWGISEINYDKAQQHFAQSIYHFVKGQDKTRLVIANDGWEMIETDIIGIHNYTHGAANETGKYQQYIKDLSTRDNLLKATPANRNILLENCVSSNHPIMLTEFGGIAYNPKAVPEDAWGYSSATSPEEYVNDYRRTIHAIYQSEALVGFCYTQLTDVEQETNGLLTYDRQPKVDLSLIKAINDNMYMED